MPEALKAAGAVGEPGRVAFVSLTNDTRATKAALMRVTAANLCPSHRAAACLLVDAVPVASAPDLGELKDLGRTLTAPVAPGQSAVLVVTMVEASTAMCIRLGETEFELVLAPVEP
ncbi:hypothetical protein ACTHAM_002904 [Cellulomonas soli]|uniref:hypothetical protein n=1 Tax=Cellulomonas soli TaxID=931535 RepID=UPI003F869D9E